MRNHRRQKHKFREPQQQQVVFDAQLHESEDSTVMEVDDNKEQLMETDEILAQMMLPEMEILETSEHSKKLKNVRQNMTEKDNCKWSEYSELN